jgi:hypothetical protein
MFQALFFGLINANIRQTPNVGRDQLHFFRRQNRIMGRHLAIAALCKRLGYGGFGAAIQPCFIR